MNILKLEEAERYIVRLFQKYDSFRVFWSVLDDEDKEGYLEKAESFVESLHLKSAKDGEDWREPIKIAVVYCAIGFMNKDLRDVETRQQAILQSIGAVANIKYNKRESAEIVTEQGVKSLTEEFPSKRAQEILRPFMYGSFSIR